MRVTRAIPSLLALMLLVLPTVAHATPFRYTFESTAALNPYSFSFTFPTLISASTDGNNLVPVPFTVNGVTFQDAALSLDWIGFSTNAGGLNIIGGGAAIQFFGMPPGAGMVITPGSNDHLDVPGVYVGPFFEIFNTTSLPTINKITVTDLGAAGAPQVPEPTSLVLLGSGMVAIWWRRRTHRSV